MQFPCGELRHHPIAIPRPDAGHRFVNSFDTFAPSKGALPSLSIKARL